MSNKHHGQHNRGPQRRDPNRPIELIVRQPYYDQIDKGQKTIEGRVAYPFLNRAQEGGALNFKRSPQDNRIIACVIDWVHRSTDFEDALLGVEWQRAVPDAQQFDQALAAYDRIYPQEKVQQLGGVVLLGFTRQGIIHA